MTAGRDGARSNAAAADDAFRDAIYLTARERGEVAAALRIAALFRKHGLWPEAAPKAWDGRADIQAGIKSRRPIYYAVGGEAGMTFDELEQLAHRVL